MHNRLLLLRAVEEQRDVSSLLRTLLLLGHRRETGWHGRLALDLPAYGKGPDGLGDHVLIAVSQDDEPEMREILSAVAGRFRIRVVEPAWADGWSRLIRARSPYPDAAQIRRLARRAERRGEAWSPARPPGERRIPDLPCVMLPSQSQGGRIYPFVLGRQTSLAPTAAVPYDAWPIGMWLPRLDLTARHITN